MSRAVNAPCLKSILVVFGLSVMRSAALVVLREGDDFADAVLTADEHGDAVEAEREAAVRWRAEAEGVEEVAELVGLLLLVHAEDAEHLGLQVLS
jgi:hypothetical protein